MILSLFQFNKIWRRRRHTGVCSISVSFSFPPSFHFAFISSHNPLFLLVWVFLIFHLTFALRCPWSFCLVPISFWMFLFLWYFSSAFVLVFLPFPWFLFPSSLFKLWHRFNSFSRERKWNSGRGHSRTRTRRTHDGCCKMWCCNRADISEARSFTTTEEFGCHRHGNRVDWSSLKPSSVHENEARNRFQSNVSRIYDDDDVTSHEEEN